MIPGGIELVAVVGVAVLLFGANKIPKLARSVGQSTGEFEKGRKQVEEELDEIRNSGQGGGDA